MDMATESSEAALAMASGLQAGAERAKQLLEREDYANAALEASGALQVLPSLADLAVVQGRALLQPLLDTVMTEDNAAPSRIQFKEAYEAFRLAAVMDPYNAEALMELERLSKLLELLPDDSMQAQTVVEVQEVGETDACGHNHSHAHARAPDTEWTADVIVIGGGAAGIGTAFSLTAIFGLDPSRVLVLERGEAIGTSFRSWPEEMRFISPSFNQQAHATPSPAQPHPAACAPPPTAALQGWTKSFDLNSIAHGTSPAYTLHAQHPSGTQYADYINEIAEAAKLNVQLRTEVLSVAPIDGGGFNVRVRAAGEEVTKRSRYVVWAAGEFQYPRESPDAFAGAGLCTHNSRVRSWKEMPGDEYVLIGGCAAEPERLALSSDAPTRALLRAPPRALASAPAPTAPSPPRAHRVASVLSARYESGVDAAVNLAKAGKQATVLASPPRGTALMIADAWLMVGRRPSSPRPARGTSRRRTRPPSWRPTRTAEAGRVHDTPTTRPRCAPQAPYTAERLREVTATGFSPRPKLMAPLRVVSVERASEGGFNVAAEWQAAPPPPPMSRSMRKPFTSPVHSTLGREDVVLHTAQPPVLCTGFEGSVVSAARHLFKFAGEAAPDEADPSSASPPAKAPLEQSPLPVPVGERRAP